MIFHPILNQLANIDLTRIRGVIPAQDQHIDGQTACFCPFCKQKRVGNQDGEIEKVNEGGSDTPHFIIYNNIRGGLYDGNGVDGNRAAEKGAVMWMCTRTRRKGYGAIELYAAIHNISLHGHGLLKACKDLVEEVYGSSPAVREHYPELFGKMDYRTVAPVKQENFSFQRRADFSPQELAALGCEVTKKDDTYTFSFGGYWENGESEDDHQKADRRQQGRFWPSDITDDFRIWALDSCVVPSVNRKVATVPEESSSGYQEVSEVIHGTPWNPLFVCFATDKQNNQGCGCVFRPAMKDFAPIAFSNTEEFTVKRVSKMLMGDRVFTYAVEHRDSDSTAVHAAIAKFGYGESYATTRKVWIDSEDSKGNPTQEQVDQEIPTGKLKARNIIYCQSPQDAICTYYTLRASRVQRMEYEQKMESDQDNTNDVKQSDNMWYHVAFMLGRHNFWYIQHGDWKQSNVEFANVQNNKLTRFAEKVIVLFPNDIKSQRMACSIVRSFRGMKLALLPETFRMEAHQRFRWLYGSKVSTVRDFILSYIMFDYESSLYGRDFGRFFHSIIKASFPATPLERKEKRNTKGLVKEIYYVVNPATVWTFMMCEGYFRSVDPDSDDKIGQYVKVDGPFVIPMNEKSMIKEVQERLTDYAQQVSIDDEDFRLMVEGISRDQREVNERSIASLPAVKLNFEGAYGPDHDHFFYENGALRITKTDIRLIDYKDIDFNIDKRALLPWDFKMPSGQAFAIYESEEYRQRKQELEAKSLERDENGNSVYTLRQISKMRSDLMQWSQTYRWNIDWYGQRERNLWPVLRVLRGFANVGWEMEEDNNRSGKAMSEEEQHILSSHFANIIFSLGRMLWLYHGKAVSAPYLMENSVRDNKRASGGSGKSTLVNIFAACAGKVLPRSMKLIKDVGDMRFQLSGYIPHVHRVIHWEDWQKGLSLKVLYNFVTQGLSFEKKHMDEETASLSDSPNHVVSSNYPLSDSDDSTVGRFPLIPFSDRFARANEMTNKPARMIDDILKDFSTEKPEAMSLLTRNQMAYICALSVQFLMKYGEIVNAPISDVKNRQLTSELGEQTVRYFQYFFAQPAVYGEPQDLKSMFDEFVRDFTDSSDAKKDGYALRTFKEKCQNYCDYNGITMNPPHLITKKADIKTNYFHLQCWVTKGYFADRRWLNDPDKQPIFVRELERSDKVCFFYRQEDKVPADYEELYTLYKDFLRRPDPLPILDEQDNPVTITDEQKAESVAGPSRRPAPQPQPQPQPVPINEDEMPF